MSKAMTRGEIEAAGGVVLDEGRRYDDVYSLRLIGWTIGDGSGSYQYYADASRSPSGSCSGWTSTRYFADTVSAGGVASARYLGGRDAYGIEPVFAADSVVRR